MTLGRAASAILGVSAAVLRMQSRDSSPLRRPDKRRDRAKHEDENVALAIVYPLASMSAASFF